MTLKEIFGEVVPQKTRRKNDFREIEVEVKPDHISRSERTPEKGFAICGNDDDDDVERVLVRFPGWEGGHGGDFGGGCKEYYWVNAYRVSRVLSETTDTVKTCTCSILSLMRQGCPKERGVGRCVF